MFLSFNLSRNRPSQRPLSMEQRSSNRNAQMTNPMKIFRCGPECEVCRWTDRGPRWKISRGGSRGGLVAAYGESGMMWLAALSKRWTGRPEHAALLWLLRGTRGRGAVRDVRAAVSFRGWRSAEARSLGFRSEGSVQIRIGEGDGLVIMRQPFAAGLGSEDARHAERSRRSALECAPVVGQDQAAVLTGARVLRSSNWMGLR